MIIIFTPGDRPNPPIRGTKTGRPTSHQPRFSDNRPLPDARVEEEAVFTDPFGAQGASDR
jgi:hypothetical protein